MKSKDVVILRKILDYCNQIKEACDIPELKLEIDKIIRNKEG